jgi:hypothetical protein
MPRRQISLFHYSHLLLFLLATFLRPQDGTHDGFRSGTVVDRGWPNHNRTFGHSGDSLRIGARSFSTLVASVAVKRKGSGWLRRWPEQRRLKATSLRRSRNSAGSQGLFCIGLHEPSSSRQTATSVRAGAGMPARAIPTK